LVSLAGRHPFPLLPVSPQTIMHFSRIILFAGILLACRCPRCCKILILSVMLSSSREGLKGGRWKFAWFLEQLEVSIGHACRHGAFLFPRQTVTLWRSCCHVPGSSRGTGWGLEVRVTGAWSHRFHQLVALTASPSPSHASSQKPIVFGCRRALSRAAQADGGTWTACPSGLASWRRWST